MYPSGQKFCTWKIIRHRRKKLREIQISGSIYCVHGLEELTSLKYPYYSKQSIDSMQSLSEYQYHNSQIWNKYFENLYGTINDPK